MHIKKEISKNDLDRYHKLGKLNLKADLPRKLKKEFKNLLKRLNYQYYLTKKSRGIISGSINMNENGKLRAMTFFYLWQFQNCQAQNANHEKYTKNEPNSIFDNWL